MAGDLPTGTEIGREQAFLELADRHFGPVYSYIQHRISLLEAVGVVHPGDLAAAELTNEVFLEALRQFPSRPPELPIYRWLRRLARRVVDREADRTHLHEQRHVSLYEPLAPEPRLADSHPEESLRLVDILPDPNAPPPSEVVASRQFQRYLAGVLGQLPESWREDFLMRAVDGYSLGEIARLEGVAPAEIRRRIDWTRQWLRAKLEEEYEEQPEAHPSAALFETAERAEPPENSRAQLLERLHQAFQAPPEREAA